MKTKQTKPFIAILLLGISFLGLNAQEADSVQREYPNREDNAKCFVCHGHTYFHETSQESGETITRKMFIGLIIDTVRFYESNHWSFACLDCHSYDYRDYPHPRQTKFEYMVTCMDCHDGDDAVAQYNFPKIAEEYEKSHHTKLADTHYSCWSCHDPHSFRLEMRKEMQITKVVVNDNAMCLKCHSGTTSTDLLLGTGLDPIIATHAWLPETEKHFRNVRCIECHGDIVDDILVAHDILPASEAVNTCAECHSSDSRLLYSLYKYQIQEGRMQKGFFGSMTTSDSYVIGMARNKALNWLSLLIFGGVLFGVFVHALIRIIRK